MTTETTEGTSRPLPAAPKMNKAAFKRLLYQAFGLRLDSAGRFVKE